MDTPVGPLLLAATDAGLLRIAFVPAGPQVVLRALQSRSGVTVRAATEPLEAVWCQLQEYFAGTRQEFELPFDWRSVGDFQAGVLRALDAVRYGQVVSYGQLAALAGHPSAVRAVASACARNPFPVVIGCHRVIRADGRPGEYLGGRAAKRALLALEAGG